MLYVNETLVYMILKLKDAKEFADEFYDLDRIDSAIHDIEQCICLDDAEKLDAEMYEKYPTIAAMLKIANQWTNSNIAYSNNLDNKMDILINRLKQDRCGIYCYMILKRKLATRIENIIFHRN